MISATAQLDDSGLAEHIERFSRATGKPLIDVARDAMKSLVRYALDYTPPASGKTKGKSAQRAGEATITRDLARAGFTPVTIKGYRTITHVPAGNVKGRPAVRISAVRIPTKINQRFADPEAIWAARKSSRHGGRITRGGKQAYYVDKRLFAPLRLRLFAAVGRLSSGWVLAADELGIADVPAWIRRHASAGRGTSLHTETSGSKITLSVINHFPAGAEDIARDVEHRIGYFTGYVKNNLARQLKAFYAGKWSESK